MENEIYNLIKKIIYEQSIKKLYEDRAEFFEYPIKIDKITFDVLDIFNNLYFDKYKECLLQNAAIFSIKTKDMKYINLFDKDNIHKLISGDKLIRAMITQRAFYNINSKIKLNRNIDDEIKNNNTELYEKLTKTYSIEVITKKLRKIILNFLNNYENSSYETILDYFITTDKLDETIIKNNDFLNKNNLNFYKKLLFKIILCDNYLYLKSMDKDISSVNDDEIDEEYEAIKYIDNKIIEFLENDDSSLMNDHDLRISLYSNFIIYNIFLKEHKHDYENTKNDQNTIKTLKKINPLYFLDMI